MSQIYSNSTTTITATTTPSLTILTINNLANHTAYSASIHSITQLNDDRLVEQFYSVQALLDYIEHNGQSVKVDYGKGVIVISRKQADTGNIDSGDHQNREQEVIGEIAFKPVSAISDREASIDLLSASLQKNQQTVLYSHHIENDVNNSKIQQPSPKQQQPHQQQLISSQQMNKKQLLEISAELPAATPTIPKIINIQQQQNNTKSVITSSITYKQKQVVQQLSNTTVKNNNNNNNSQGNTQSALALALLQQQNNKLKQTIAIIQQKVHAIQQQQQQQHDMQQKKYKQIINDMFEQHKQKEQARYRDSANTIADMAIQISQLKQQLVQNRGRVGNTIRQEQMKNDENNQHKVEQPVTNTSKSTSIIKQTPAQAITTTKQVVADPVKHSINLLQKQKQLNQSSNLADIKKVQSINLLSSQTSAINKQQQQQQQQQPQLKQQPNKQNKQRTSASQVKPKLSQQQIEEQMHLLMQTTSVNDKIFGHGKTTDDKRQSKQQAKQQVKKSISREAKHNNSDDDDEQKDETPKQDTLYKLQAKVNNLEQSLDKVKIQRQKLRDQLKLSMLLFVERKQLDCTNKRLTTIEQILKSKGYFNPQQPQAQTASKIQPPQPKKPVINAIDWLDMQNQYLKRLTLTINQISAKQKYAHIFCKNTIKNYCSLTIKIKQMKSLVLLGVADATYRNEGFLGNLPNMITYGSNGMFRQGKQRRENQGGCFEQGETITMEADLKYGVISWKVGKVVRHKMQNQTIFQDKTTQWVPYIYLSDKDDMVKLVEYQN